MSDETAHLKSEIRRLRKMLSRCTPSLETMLKLRGFSVYKKEPAGDLLVPAEEYAADFFDNLKKYSFRLFLRDVIRHQDSFTLDDVTRFATRDVSTVYLDFLLQAGLAEQWDQGFRLRKRPVKSFGETLEWLVARLIRDEFQAETAWGVKFRKPAGGDYDLLARIDGLLLYMEVKSSPPKQIYNRGISFFLQRAEDLSPDIAVFFVDTELRMKDKIVPLFEEELLRRYGKPHPARRIVKELFHINGKIFIINAKGGIAANIERIMAFLWHKGPFIE